jgi:3-hydroxyacyl-CoA dehydrogenase/enoyl-CoA hydratase/3-hydroxybutyryl-CoA epimerase
LSGVQPVLVDRATEPIVALEVRRDGIALIVVDAGAGTQGALAPSFAAQLADIADRIEQDAGIAAAILTGGSENGMGLGIDVDLLKSIKFATDAERLAREAGQIHRRLEQLSKPIVAAVHGETLGAAFELALSCHALIATDDPETLFGFPELPLGLVPAANGLLRVARRAGLRAAIELLLGGTSVTAAKGHALGLVDDLCPWPILLDVAARQAKALVGHLPRVRDVPIDFVALAMEKNPLGRALLFKRARDQAHARTRGHHLAIERALDVLERFARQGFDAAAEREAELFGELVVSEPAHRLIELRCATTALARPPSGAEWIEAREVKRVGIIGGGLMGSGIASVTVQGGATVRLKEKDDLALGRAVRAVKELLDDRHPLLARISPTTDYSGLRHADVVIEAVSEDLALKQAILRDVEPRVAPTCVLASCTSSIPIAKIAQATTIPARVLGLHYFSPVGQMPLIELVRADKTEPWAVATAIALGSQQKKTVIVVKDTPGFYTTRILAPLLNEAAQMLGEGLSVQAIDDAMMSWGFPVGPLRLLDEVGIDVASQVAKLLHGAFGDRMAPPNAIAKLVSDDRLGRKNHRGIYRYDDRPQNSDGKRAVDACVYSLLGVRPTTMLPAEEIQMRCALAMINEAMRCFGEGTIRGARDGDVGASLGLGFPAFRGGPFRYVDTIGAAEAVRRVQGYADRFGERWRPSPLLVHMAKKGERFYT